MDELRRKLVKAVGYTFMTILLLGAALAASVMWRLSEGPLALTFLTSTVQNTINANLSGMQVAISDVILERDTGSERPRIRLRDIRLRDSDGNMIARAPRAAVEINARALLTGRIVPEELALIGPRIMARRLFDGTVQLGFGITGSEADAEQRSTKQDRVDASPEMADEGAQQSVDLVEFLHREITADQQETSAVSSVMAVRITHATVSLYDEANDALWYAPKVNLVLRRMPYGFALFADASIASGKEPWRTEIVANYRAADQRFTVSARLFDLIPADLSDEVFALSQLAQMRLPVSGHAEVEFTSTGIVTKASAELTAAAGMVGFPDYIADPILIDEGLLRFDYDPASGDIVIGNSAIFVGGSQAQLEGRLQPLRDDRGRLKSLRLVINANNVAIDAAGAVRNPFVFDEVNFDGVASIQDARLEVDDLVLRSGDAGMRVRGRFLGEEDGIGIYLGGVMRDVTAGMVKKLWPPIVAPGARQWVGENVIAGRIPEGTFQIALPASVIAAALRDEPIPDGMINSQFSLADFKFRYFGDLPPMAGDRGTAVMSGNNFRIEGEGGVIDLASGMAVDVINASIAITDLAARESPAIINVEANGRVHEFVELLDQEPLRIASRQNIVADRLSGNVGIKLTVKAPLSRFIRKEQVKVTAAARIENGALKKAFQSVDLTDMNLDITFSDETIEASGPAKINGIGARLDYVRGFSGPEQIEIETTLDSGERQQLGADLSAYLTGKTPVKMKADIRDGTISLARIDVDLSNAALKLDSIGWQRDASKGTKASFDLDLSDAATIRIAGLNVTGDDLKIAGDVEFGSNGNLREARLSSFRLNSANDLQVSLKDSNGLLVLAVSGNSFDARPLMGNLFAKGGQDASRPSLQPVQVTANVVRIHANHGEIISNVAGTLQLVGGQVQRADLRGQHANNAPIVLQVTPDQRGAREMRVVGRDGGAALRAANLYSKISGGILEFQALLGAGTDDAVQKGKLVIRSFEVFNEQALSSIQNQSPNQRKAAAGPRRNGQYFAKLTLPFSTDAEFVRIGDALVRGPEMCASAQGIIRKADGLLDIGGTITPACAINSAFGEVPVIGEILMGGKGQGLFGLNYALKGTMREPQFLVNPVSAIAPGFLRNLFGIGGASGIAADGTIAPPPKPRETNK
jgi:hypothetical protein